MLLLNLNMKTAVLHRAKFPDVLENEKIMTINNNSALSSLNSKEGRGPRGIVSMAYNC